jgi:hypothetical protein
VGEALLIGYLGCLLVGTILMAIALWQTGSVPRWLPILFALSLAIAAVAPAGAVALPLQLPIAIAMVILASRIWQMTALRCDGAVVSPAVAVQPILPGIPVPVNLRRIGEAEISAPKLLPKCWELLTAGELPKLRFRLLADWGCTSPTLWTQQPGDRAAPRGDRDHRRGSKRIGLQSSETHPSADALQQRQTHQDARGQDQGKEGEWESLTQPGAGQVDVIQHRQ